MIALGLYPDPTRSWAFEGLRRRYRNQLSEQGIFAVGDTGYGPVPRGQLEPSPAPTAGRWSCAGGWSHTAAAATTSVVLRPAHYALVDLAA